ncbi:MAG: GGDEF domain-containing protein [Bacillota bacterium]|nr:GGDEF domain-containing protein [Bacillota bacterium]
MNRMVKRASFLIMLYLICIIGLFSLAIAAKELLGINNQIMNLELLMIAALFLIFSPWRVSLPSGASWRPGIAFILFSILYFDFKLVILVAVPGMILSLKGKKAFLFEFLLTIGHLSLGIYAAGFIFRLLEKHFTPSIYSYLAITVCMIVHFCVNRFVAALIVSFKKRKNFIHQVILVKIDLNWGYTCVYILGIIMFLTFRVYNIPGLLLVTFLLITLYKSVTYYNKLKVIEKKVYTDCLTNAENRTSWEEFVKHVDTKGHYKSGIVFMLDLDHFKIINDTYGHDFGDQILQEFVSFMKRELRKGYRLFRYGGDEFILFVQSSEEEYGTICENIRAILTTQNSIWKQKGLPVSISFGNAFYSKHNTIANIVRNADKLMYLNKFEKKKLEKPHYNKSKKALM